MKDLSLHLMDIIQNSITASCSKITVSINADKESDLLEIEIADDGVGMDKELLESVSNPFTTTRKTRKIGLGIPLLKDSANLSGGCLIINSQKGVGTVVKASFGISHIDRIPLGDLAETIVTIIVSYPDIGFELNLGNTREFFRLDLAEIKEKLGDVPINNYEVVSWIKEYINEGIKLIFGGVLNEVVS